jgi:branched-chain amino acid transport system permease protein
MSKPKRIRNQQGSAPRAEETFPHLAEILRNHPMFYREAGQYKTTYASDQQIFPIKQDRWAMALLLAFAFLVVPAISSQYFLAAILIPFLVFALAALGLNILTGYAGQISLGAAGFMAVGAFAAYNLILRVPGMPFLLAIILAGIAAALVGMVFGLPSLRIRGFYLAVATLAAQFFIVWALTKFGWFSNYSSSGVITAQKISILGYVFESPQEKYLLTLAIVCVLGLLAKNMMRANTGRSLMAIRDMDVAAEVIGIRMLRTKMLAFGISSFYIGVAGALYAYTYIGTVEPEGFNLDLSFRILFMIIIGGMGSILGSFLGSAFIILLPIFLNVALHPFLIAVGLNVGQASISSIELMIFGALIVFFLIVEPHGLARLWQITKEKLRIWPFPH